MYQGHSLKHELLLLLHSSLPHRTLGVYFGSLVHESGFEPSSK